MFVQYNYITIDKLHIWIPKFFFILFISIALAKWIKIKYILLIKKTPHLYKN